MRKKVPKKKAGAREVPADNVGIGLHGGVLPWPAETHPSQGIARRVATATDKIALQIREMKWANPAKFFRH